MNRNNSVLVALENRDEDHRIRSVNRFLLPSRHKVAHLVKQLRLIKQLPTTETCHLLLKSTQKPLMMSQSLEKLHRLHKDGKGFVWLIHVRQEVFGCYPNYKSPKYNVNPLEAMGLAPWPPADDFPDMMVESTEGVLLPDAAVDFAFAELPVIAEQPSGPTSAAPAPQSVSSHPNPQPAHAPPPAPSINVYALTPHGLVLLPSGGAFNPALLNMPSTSTTLVETSGHEVIHFSSAEPLDLTFPIAAGPVTAQHDVQQIESFLSSIPASYLIANSNFSVPPSASSAIPQPSSETSNLPSPSATASADVSSAVPNEGNPPQPAPHAASPVTTDTEHTSDSATPVITLEHIDVFSVP